MYTVGAIRYNDVWISNDLGASWQLSTGNAGWAARGYMAAASIGGTIILMGGYGECTCIYVFSAWRSAWRGEAHVYLLVCVGVYDGV